MYSDTRPAPLDDMHSQLSEFRIDQPVEIRALLKSLMDRNVMLNLSGSCGAVYSTTLWTVDANQRKLAFSADLMAPALQALVESDDAVAVGYLDQIKVQFEVNERLLVHGRRACVLQSSWPAEIYRFQRRSAYRVRTLERNSPKASSETTVRP